MRSDETTSPPFDTSCCNNALSGTDCTSLFLVLFQVGGDKLHSHQCHLGRRHCQCLLRQGLPEEWLAPLLMTSVLKPGFPNASAPALHKLIFQSETDLMIPDCYNCPWLEDTVMVSCSFRTVLTTSLAGLLGKVACSAAFFS